jgi:hypothetical protein
MYARRGLNFREGDRMFLFQAWPRVRHALARHGRARRRNAADGRRCKIVGAFLLQVTPDLPNPAEYEADRHRDRDFVLLLKDVASSILRIPTTHGLPTQL